MVSVRGKTPIPMTQWGYTRGNRQSELFKLEHVQVGNSILLMTWHRREPKQPGSSPTSPFPQQYSQVPHLSICGHVSISWKREVWKSSSRFLPRAFCAGWFSPCFGNGHANPQWKFQLEATIKRGRFLVSPVFRFDHSFVCLGGGKGYKLMSVVVLQVINTLTEQATQS